MSRITGRGAGSASDPQPYRLRGFRRAFAEFGAEMRPEWSFRTAPYETGGIETARLLLALPDRPTAMCVVNDYLALGLMVEAMRAGVRVPEELSIVSHDNQPVADLCPVPLTSVTHPSARIAEAVVELLTARLTGEVAPDAPPRTVTVIGELVERASVASWNGENP
jgi:LacI family transcriptional regulator